MTETDRETLLFLADALCRRAKGERASFVVFRNINFTNICYMSCQFCGFAKRREEQGAEVLDPKADHDHVRSECTLYLIVSRHFLVEQVFPPARKKL